MASVEAGLAGAAADPERVEERQGTSRQAVLGRLEKMAIGTRKAGGVTVVRRSEPAGCVLFGPYWQLPSGAYRLNFRCRSGRPRWPRQPVLGVEVIAMNRVQLAWLDLTMEELQGETGCLEFSVPPVLGLGAGDEARLEFRFFHMGNADLTIGAVDLQNLPTGEFRPMPLRQWRMLGRLQKTSIGKQTSEGVAVSQAERPGRLLDGGRPFLQLPRGDYRLGFCCAVGTPRMESQPVLGVEIIACRRWRGGRFWSLSSMSGLPARGGLQQAWADFTARQLNDGSGAVDFTVPTELSLEGGQEILFGTRFFHLGNADLTISAVELRQIAEEEASPALPREWRLLGRLIKGSIGAHQTDCVTVRRKELQGVLLYGGRPDLPLAQGQYRLSFNCRPGPPRSASAPVLAVDVLARTRLLGAPAPNLARSRARGWQEFWRSLLESRSVLRVRRQFTAEALRAEPASVDFEVPKELSRDGGNDVTFEFRFRHLGNADLTISSVNLLETITAEQLCRDTPRSSLSKLRTKVLIIGNCQAQTVHEALVRSSEFNDRLDTKYHFVGLQKELHEFGRAELESSDILLVQDIRDWENYPLLPFIPADVQIIKFPLLHFASLWPFDHYNGPGDKEAYEREWPNLTFLYHDGLLARLRKEIPGREQRLQAYRALSVDGVINYVRLHDFEKRRLVAMDKQFGLGIGQFILENFQKRRLFHTTNHPNGQIIALLMRYLLAQLGMDQVYQPNATLDHLKRLQVPVHPKVAKALGVKWASESTKYSYSGEQITWETYFRRYIDHYG